MRTGQPIHSMFSHVTGFDLNQGLTLEADLDPKDQPYLYDHALRGIPVLPGVMGIEGFSVAAKHIGSVLASGKDGFEVDRLEDIHFLAAFKFYRKEPRRVTWVARAVRDSQGLVVTVTLESSRTLKTGTDEHMHHFSGKVFLKSPEKESHEANAKAPEWNGRYTVKAEDIYRLYFHGPAFQALVELCFQTAGIWEIGKTGTMALPRAIESLTIYRQSINGANIYAVVIPSASANGELHFDARVVDSYGRLYLDLKDYRTSPMPDAVEPSLLAPLQELMKDS